MLDLYDRADSAFAQLSPDEFDFEHVLRGASWLHLSGIVCALGDGPASAAEFGGDQRCGLHKMIFAAPTTRAVVLIPT